MIRLSFPPSSTPRPERGAGPGGGGRWAAAGLAVIAVATIGIGARPLFFSAAPAPGQNAGFVAFVSSAMDSLQASLISLEREPDTAAFDRSRDAYKRVEGVAEFYSPALAAAINGRREELDDDDAALPDPRGSGFARVEKAFASAHASAARSGEVVAAASDMLVAARQLHVLLDAVHPTDAQLFEIGRQELVRASVLGVAGYDTPSTKRGITETAQALAGLNELYARTGYARWTANASATARLHSALTAAIGYLRAHPDYDKFNRLEFLTAYAAPAARALQAAHEADTREWVVQPRAWRTTSAWILDPGALDPRVYAPAAAPPPTDSLVALGARLFGDPGLSRDGVRSCAACHQPARAFSDGLARAAPLPGRSLRPTRNTPTLLNAALQPAQFDDERAVTLEDQVGTVLGSAAEMGGSVQIAARHVAASSAYDSAFARAFGDVNATPEAAMRRRLEFAVAAYVRSLVAMDSRADRAMRGDTLALTAEERRGFDLFMGRRAAVAVVAPTFGGPRRRSTSVPMSRSSACRGRRATSPASIRMATHVHPPARGGCVGGAACEPQSKPIAVRFALVGLYLHVERQFTGREVQRVHMKLAQRKEPWPVGALPEARGAITALDVAAAADGVARDAMIHAWCGSVWAAYAGSRELVAGRLRERGVL